MRANRLGFAGFGAGLGLVMAMGAACSHAPAAAPVASAPPPPVPPCPQGQPVRVSVNASARLNPGEKGEALATVVRLYQLKGVGKLTGISFDDLLDHDKDTLGEDFLSVQEITINPGDKLDPRVTRNPEAGYLLAVALFRRPAGTTWKVVRKLAPPDPEYCRADAEHVKADSATRLYLDENRVELR